jgi:protocatechuate 3,4-dioxygenase beta subunit
MAMYSIGDLGRREILMMSAVLAGASIVFPARKATAEAKLQRTPDQILGPFYPLSELPQTADLTRVSGRSGRAEGQMLNVMGRVLNLAAQAVRDAKVEGSAILTTDAEGRYRFKTIKPAAYPAGPDRMRPAHIHFQVSGRQDKIVTQMYFEGDPYNNADPFLNSVGGAERQALLVKKFLEPSPDYEPGSKMVIFDIVLYKG